MKVLGLLTFLLGIVSFQADARQQAPNGPVMDDSGISHSTAPQMHTAPARGSIDSGGYSAPAAVKARSALTADIMRLQIAALKPAYCVKGSLPCYLRERKPADALALTAHASRSNSALHDLAGIAAEMLGQADTAEQQFRLAANQQATEQNVFAWGAQLLLLGRVDQATEVFTNALRQHPGSVLLQTGLGASLYSQGHIPQALNTLLKAAERDPSSLLPYPLIASIAEASSREAPADLEPRLNVLVQRAPDNPMACFAYAVSLRKPRQDGQIEDLMKRVIAMDPALAQAHFRLAVLYTERGEYARAIPEYQKTLEADPELAEARYRLGQAYMHTGQIALAQQQLKQHQALRAAQQGDAIDIPAVINRALATNCGQACP